MAAPAPADIFGAGVKAADAATKEKRVSLKNIDTVASKALNPYGASSIEEISLPELWAMASKGDKFARFFTELAAAPDNCKDAEYRVGVGLSRLAEVLEACIEEFLARDNLHKLLKEKVVAKVKAEAEELLPHVKALNAGRAAFQKEETFGGLKRRRTESGEKPTEAKLKEAAEALRIFLCKGETSNLRAFVATMSAGGVFYAAHAADKTARAWLNHAAPAVTKESVTQAVLARAAGSHPAKAALQKETFTGDLFDD